MAYDPVKAHEYYEKYRKKGLKKGRKRGKGRKKTTGGRRKKAAAQKKIKKESLIGLSNSGLNEAGKMQWAMQKKELQEKMNAELQAASSDEQKAEIRERYQNQALESLMKIKTDNKYHDEKIEGASNGGLNDAGKMKWAIAKKSITSKMNAELANATSDEQKAEIKERYTQEAKSKLDELKADKTLVNEKKKKTKTKKTASKKQTRQLKKMIKSLRTSLKNMDESTKAQISAKIDELMEKLGG